jgi:hypothetical protein
MNTALDIQDTTGRQIADVGATEQGNPVVSILSRLVMDPSLPVERAERVFAMYYEAQDRARQQAREDAAEASRRAYFSAMSACQEDLPVVVKNRRNSHTKSNYADLSAIEEQAMPIIHKHGFGVSFQPDGYNDLGELLIKWEISHAGGYVRNGVGAIPVDGAGSQGKVNKTGTQAFGSTATYGRRYLLCMLFNISTGDDRDGNAAPEDNSPISQDQLMKLRELLEVSGADAEIFCEKWKIEALPDLPAGSFSEAYGSLERWHKAQGAR